MALNYNYLSGSTTNIDIGLIFEMLRGGESWLGFGRNIETWGQCALVKYVKMSGQSWPDGVVGDAANAGIYDQAFSLFSIPHVGNEVAGAVVHIGRFEKADSTSVPTLVTELNFEIAEQLETIFINEEWMLIKGIPPTFAFSTETIDSTQNDFYILNSAKNMNNLLRIEKMAEYTYPGLSTKCVLKYNPSDSSTAWNVATAMPIYTNNDLERRVNLIGEYVVTGIDQDFIDWFDANDPAQNGQFFLVDSTGGLLLDGIWFDEKIVGPEETAYVFKYNIRRALVGGGEDSREVRFKLTSTTNINNRFAVFHESLPVYNPIAPIADNNPPGLSVSYLRNPLVKSSIMDVNGLTKLDTNDIWLSKELTTQEEIDFFADDASNLIGGVELDVITIDVDPSTDTTTTVTFARTKNLNYALRYSFSSVTLDKTVAGEPNGETALGLVYRQLFITFKPQVYDSESGGFVAPDGTATELANAVLYNPDQHQYDLGQIFYIANKIPVYRKYIAGGEVFKIVV